MNISVAMTTFNGGNFLKKQLDSITAQTLPANEIIVCDDLSDDNTQQILKNYKDESELSFYINSQRLGVAPNFKKAVSLTKKENWVALSDQDDIWLPQKLEKTAAILETINDDNKPCIVYTDLTLIDKSEMVLAESFRAMFGHNGYWHNINSLLFNNFVNGCTVIMNGKAKEWFATIPNDIRYYDEWLALIAFTFGKGYYLKEPTVLYRQHNANVTISSNTKLINTKSRALNMFGQLKNLVLGKDDFLAEQIEAIAAFYQYYKNEMTPDKQLVFQGFLRLKNKHYFARKMAYRNMVRGNQ